MKNPLFILLFLVISLSSFANISIIKSPGLSCDRYADDNTIVARTVSHAVDSLDPEEDTTIEMVEFVEEKEENADDEIFIIVEDMPSFNNGDINTFREYIQQNIKYPKEALENGIQGRVYVQFIVNKTGEISDAKIVRGIDPLLDNEALRIIESSPKWTPGMQRGSAVNVQLVIPVSFIP